MTDPVPFDNAVDLLDADHKLVESMFLEYDALCEEGASDEVRQTLAERICREIAIHAQIEEEIFYPAVRKALDDDELIEEALGEHAEAEELIGYIQAMNPSSYDYDATVKALAEAIDEHVLQDDVAESSAEGLSGRRRDRGERRRAGAREVIRRVAAVIAGAADGDEEAVRARVISAVRGDTERDGLAGEIARRADALHRDTCRRRPTDERHRDRSARRRGERSLEPIADERTERFASRRVRRRRRRRRLVRALLPSRRRRREHASRRSTGLLLFRASGGGDRRDEHDRERRRHRKPRTHRS